MEIKYERSFYTKISEYQVQVEVTKTGLPKVVVQRYMANRESGEPSEYLNVHPDILLDLIGALEECRDLLGIKQPKVESNISLDKQQEIRNRYLRGLSIKDLCIQFNMDLFTIEKVLRNGNIEIVSPKMSMPYKNYRSYGKSRFSK